MAVVSVDIIATGPEDAFARTHPTLNWPWNNTDAIDFLGTDLKSVNPENVMFVRFKLEGNMPKGALALRSKFFLRAAISVDTPGDFRVGWLNQDGIWDHASSVGFTPGGGAGEYPFSYTLPFPTGPNTDVINPGILFGNAFFVNPVHFTSAQSNDVFSIGDPSHSPTFVLGPTDLLGLLIGASHALGWTHIALVVDPGPNVPPLTASNLNILTNDLLPGFGPALRIEYEEQPPTITSAPGPPTATSGVLYEHVLTANDPFPGDSSTVTFALVASEDGMTVVEDGGVWFVRYTPSAVSLPTVRSISVQATDEDGFTSAVQAWTITVLSGAPGGKVGGDLTIDSAVSGGLAVESAIGGSLEATAGVVGELETVGIAGELDVAPAVGGSLEVSKC